MSSDGTNGSTPNAGNNSERLTGRVKWFNNRAGFGFVTVKNDEQADQIIEKYNGYQFKETPLKIEKALPRTKNKSESENTEADPKPINKNNTSKGKKSRRDNKDKGGLSKTASGPSSSSNEAVQPDPRWADALAELKQRLAATSNS